MLRWVRTEEIYDAAIDDDAFEQLASRMAQAIGARSGVIHWRDLDSDREEISYSGYFSAEAMATFERDFAKHDLWSAAIRDAERANRVWDCEQLVPTSVYESSPIYNDWVRAMGDDTFLCLGGAIRNGSTVGEIGFHRGKGQGPFDEATVRRSNAALTHLRRMITIRSKLIAAEGERAATAAVLDASAHAVLTLSPQGRVLHTNQAADELLGRGDALSVRRHRLVASLPQNQSALEEAISRAAAPKGTEASGLWLHRPDGAPYQVSVASANKEGGGRYVIIVVTTQQGRRAGDHRQIRTLYGLTKAEAEIAAQLAEGASIDSLAELRRVSANTVRTQLKTIASKMGCNRQSQMVAMIRSLPHFR